MKSLSKTCYISTRVVPSLFLSQHALDYVGFQQLKLEPQLNVIIKRGKIRGTLNTGPVLASLKLLTGAQPRCLSITKDRSIYMFYLHPVRYYYVLDLYFFILIPRLRKTQELMRTIYAPNYTRFTVNDVGTMQLLRNLDIEISQVSGVSVDFLLTRDFLQTKRFTFWKSFLNF
jgi:hypothetical protein